jgi:hypothetical protein
MSRRYPRGRCVPSDGVSVVPGGRFSGLDRCGMPSGGVDRSLAAAWTVPSGAGPGAGPVMGTAGSTSAGAGAGRGTAGTSSASAVGALKVNAATIPSAPDINVSAAVSLSNLTAAPFPNLRRAGATGCFNLIDENVTSGVDVTKRGIRFLGSGNTFHLEFDVTRRTAPQLWCSNAVGILDNVI